ncbi:DNA replication/repair protein RecF [Hahella sp. CCB-MM4]|uniref:DNA replication/repair protein RecF n=1 Tax=Hahella sp. (strain CCB-MM4) TaxID=1926491 RepID=UPI000B9ADF20|nr:DNA replication/repair protein RecF [Hahella sp. CCB-MM4]OZG73242.1 DNA replication/repair protein RecF [Hahella sp. CCB-MM4]
MTIKRISFSGIRNLDDVTLETDSPVVFIQGDNGSGKTSLIEGLYLTGRGSSFRSHDLDHVINYSKDQFVCHALLGDQQRIGVSRHKILKKTQVKINGDSAQSLSELAEMLPLLLVTPLTFDLLNGGPSGRRRFLDWGVFHVEPGYKHVWQRWRKLLIQRNKLLKNGTMARLELASWTDQFVSASKKIDEHRKRFYKELVLKLESNLNEGSQFNNDLSNQIEVKYDRGWSNNSSMEELLERSLELDQRRGFTSVGPHKADLKFSAHGISAKEVLSRGQQKVLITHLLLAQLQLLREKRNLDCTVLIDDLGAELDQENQYQLLNTLLEKGAQVFCTMVDAEQVLNLSLRLNEKYHAKMFHVEHGCVTPLNPGD